MLKQAKYEKKEICRIQENEFLVSSSQDKANEIMWTLRSTTARMTLCFSFLSCFQKVQFFNRLTPTR